MADNAKDIALNIAATVSGQEQIQALAKHIETLAKDGGAAAPEFQKLAVELNQIASQAGAVDTFRKLTEGVEQTAKEFREAQTTVGQLGNTLKEAQDRTQTYRNEQASLEAAIRNTAKELREAQSALRTYRAEADDNTKSTDTYKLKVADLRKTIADLSNTQAEQREKLVDARRAATEAADAQKAVNREYDAAVRVQSQLSRSLGEQNAALHEAQAAMTQAGVAADNLVDAEQHVIVEQDRVRQAAVAASEAYDQQKAILQSVAQANERAVAQARAAAEARAAAAREGVEAERAQQQAVEAQTLAARLAAQEEQADSDRLARIVEANRAAMAKAAQDQLAAERAAQGEAAALAERLAAEEAQVAAAAKQAQAAMQEAFGTVGVKSAHQLEAEIQKIKDAMQLIATNGNLTGQQLRNAMTQASQRVQDLERQLRAANGEATLMDRTAGFLNNSFTKLAGLVGGGFVFQQLGREAVEANANLQKLRLGLESVYGSSDVAAQKIEFLRNAAQRAGVSFDEVGAAYVKLSASTQAANIPMSQTDALFSALTKSAANLGLSGAKVADMLNAVGQMASKGVVQMEELRGQLGDALPGALPKVAAGLGITTRQLEEMSKEGKLLAEDVIPALTKALQETSKQDVKTITSEWERFKNVMSEVATTIGEGAIGKAIGFLGIALAKLAEGAGLSIAFIGEAFTVTGKEIGAVIAAIVNRDFSNLRQTLNDISKESEDKLGRMANRIRGIEPAAGDAAKGMERLADTSGAAGGKVEAAGNAMAGTGTKAEAGAAGVGKNADAHGAAGTAATSNATAQTAAGDAAQKAGQQFAAGEEPIARVVARYTEFTKAVEQSLKISTATAAARRIEGELLTNIARLTGDEVAVLNARATAARANAAASADVARNEQALLDLKQSELAEEEKWATAQNGRVSPARQKQIDDLRAEVGALKEKVAASKGAADMSNLEAQSAELAGKLYLDNSGRLAELKKAYENSAQAAEAMHRGLEQGVVTAEQAKEADIAMAQAQALYKDAINDTVAATARQVQTADVVLRLTGENTQSLDAAAKAAKAHSDAVNLSTTALENQAKAIRQNIEDKKAEAAATGDVDGKIAAQIKDLETLLGIKEAEIVRSQQAAQAAKDEAAFRDVAAKTYRDNGDMVHYYGAMAADAELKLKAVIQAEKEGKASAQDVAQATRDAAKAKALYADALRDVVDALRAEAAMHQANAAVYRANIDLKMEQARTAEVVAKSLGDESAAIEAQIKQKVLEGEARKANADAIRQEANDEINAANAQREELARLGQLTPTKEQEIDARIRNAQAKKVEADAAAESVKQIEAETEALRKLQDMKRRGADAEGFAVDTKGNRINATTKPAPYVSMNGDWVYVDKNGNMRRSNVQPKQDANGDWYDPSQQSGPLNSLGNKSNTGALGAGGASKSGLATLGGTGSSADPAPTPAPTPTGTSHTVNVNIGGQQKAINTASASDSQALVDLLKGLENASTRASL